MFNLPYPLFVSGFNRNSECYVSVRVRMAVWPSERASEIERPRGSKTAPGRAKGLEENGAGPSFR